MNVWSDILIELQIIIYTTVYITYTGVRRDTYYMYYMSRKNVFVFNIRYSSLHVRISIRFVSKKGYYRLISSHKRSNIATLT